MKTWRKTDLLQCEASTNLWTVVIFHTVVHILGIFTLMLLPTTLPFGMEAPGGTFPAPFTMVLVIAALMFVWSVLKLPFRSNAGPIVWLVALILPLSCLGTLKYAQTFQEGMDAVADAWGEDVYQGETLFYVRGEVRRPGVYRFQKGMTLSDALAEAEGRMPETDKVVLDRKGRRLRIPEAALGDAPLETGDVVVVPR